MSVQVRIKLQQEQLPSLEQENPIVRVLPTQPIEAYRRLQSESLEAVKKIQRIPFPCIRELILMYILQDKEIIDLTASEFLNEKLTTTNFQKQHDQANAQYDQLLKELSKLKKLEEVTKIYVDMRDKLVGDESRRTLEKRYDGRYLQNQIGKLDVKKGQKLKQELIKKNQTVEQIESEYNANILELFQNHAPTLKNSFNQFHELLENINWFKLFIEDLEKAYVFILTNRQVSNNPNNQLVERLVKEVFHAKLIIQIDQLENFLQNQLKVLFQWRSKVKYGNETLPVPQAESKCQERRQNLKKNVYKLLPQIIIILKNDKQFLKEMQTKLNKQYNIFLSGYYDAKEVELFFQRDSKIQEIIESQRQQLTKHLKRNYNMMVNYRCSKKYNSWTEEFLKASKGYLRDILSRKVAPLNLAINFINNDYDVLFKKACEGKNETKELINRKLKQLQQGLNDKAIYYILQQSCKKMIAIADSK